MLRFKEYDAENFDANPLRYFKFLSSFLHAVAIFLPGPVRFVEA
jgi:hypothetical protein